MNTVFIYSNSDSFIFSFIIYFIYFLERIIAETAMVKTGTRLMPGLKIKSCDEVAVEIIPSA